MLAVLRARDPRRAGAFDYGPGFGRAVSTRTRPRSARFRCLSLDRGLVFTTYSKIARSDGPESRRGARFIKTHWRLDLHFSESSSQHHVVLSARLWKR